MSYGTDILYQRLATEARRIWLDWNAQSASSAPSDLPTGLSPQDRLFEDCGFMRIGLDAELTEFEKTTLEGFEREALRATQYVINDVEEVERAKRELGDEVAERKFDPLRRKEKGEVVAGVYDATAGFTRASKACFWVKYLCEKAGVKFVLGEEKGKIVRIIKDEQSERTKGIIAADGKVHEADLVIVAGEYFTWSNSSVFKGYS
jgi:FAD dependent oxidoreductase.